MAETKSPEHQIKEAIWTYGGWAVLLGLTLGAGMALGYIRWGDAVLLRATNAELTQKILNATGEKENANHQLVAAQEELGRCQRKLTAAAAPAAGGAAAPTAGGSAAPATP
ncbi:MAG TPA: hypothetical protein VMR29_03420 [Candidatus Binatia bacterium]|nr:hypothetical protein [Candidatus Binatia bacterium]